MCTPSIPKDDSAQLAQQQEQQRESNVATGQKAIDTAFSNFNDDYYNKNTAAYEANYDPQVDTQFQRAQQKQTYASARNGVLNSTPAITDQDRLNDAYASQRQGVASNAIASTDALKGQVAQQKNQLYALNESAADPTLAASSAAASAGTIPSTPQYSTLGDLFSGLVNSGNSYLIGQSKANLGGYTSAYPGFSPGGGLASGGGSGSVVG